MLYKKENPIGIDAKIQSLQVFLFNKLSVLWGLDENNFDGYGRTYIKRSDRKVLPEAYIGKNEYRNVLNAEVNKFFFIARNTLNKINALQFETVIELCFIVDLAHIKEDVEHRADYEVINDVQQLINYVDNINLISVDTDPSKVFSGFTFKETDNLHPYFVFKLNINVRFLADETCQCIC
jgi:hypothetical protein